MVSKAVLTTADKHLSQTGSSPYRFRRDNRLLDAAAFNRVFNNATRSRDRWFIVLSKENNSPKARLGLAISKKQCRAATARNRIKRIVRESFRQHQAELQGLDVVVMNQSAARTGSNRQLFDSLAEHWRRCATAAQQISGQGE